MQDQFLPLHFRKSSSYLPPIWFTTKLQSLAFSSKYELISLHATHCMAQCVIYYSLIRRENATTP